MAELSLVRLWRAIDSWVRARASHPDPLAETSNWIALAVGSHLPLWPLYVIWAAGNTDAWPSSLLTVALAPAFLAVPAIARRSSLAGRIATPLLGIANTVWTTWILGLGSATSLFLIPCAALAVLTFRVRERLVMLFLTTLPLLTWYFEQNSSLQPLHHYDPRSLHGLIVLNACSIAVLMALIGWLQAGAYRRLEERR